MYRYQATEAFWASFHSLPDAQRESTRRGVRTGIVEVKNTVVTRELVAGEELHGQDVVLERDDRQSTAFAAV